MELLLSGAKHPNSEQRDVTASTGGYISVTPVPNGRLNALFDDIGCYEKEKKVSSTLGLFLKNNSGQVINNIVLQQVYNNTIGEDDNQASFEWAAVEPKDNEYIERLGNRYEYPYHAEFFDPTCRREDAILEIKTAGEVGDVLNILGMSVVLDGNEINDVVFAIVEKFEDHSEFKVEYHSENSVYFKRKELIQTEAPIEILTPGDATAEPVSFSGFKDNGILLIESLQPNESIGLWITRTVKKDKKVDCFLIEEKYDNAFGEDFNENRLEDLDDSEECLEVIFSFS